MAMGHSDAVQPRHNHHFKTWFFQGRPRYTLATIQIDLTAQAVHETWAAIVP